MKLPLALSLALAAAVQAGSVNLVNLVVRDTTRFTFTQGDAKETFELPAGGFSGKFQANTDTVIRCIEVPGTETTVAAKEGSLLVVFHEAAGKPQWRVLPSKPTEGKLSLRVLNLCPEPVTVKLGEKEIPIKPDSIHEEAEPEGRRLAVSIPGTDAKATFNPDEPSAGLAILSKKDDAWHITIIPDI